MSATQPLLGNHRPLDNLAAATADGYQPIRDLPPESSATVDTACHAPYHGFQGNQSATYLPNDVKRDNSHSIENAMAVKELEETVKEINKLHDLIEDDITGLVRPYLTFYDSKLPVAGVSSRYPMLDLLTEACQPRDEKSPALMKMAHKNGQDVCYFNSSIDMKHIETFLKDHKVELSFGHSELESVYRAASTINKLLVATHKEKLEYNRGLRFLGFEDSPPGLLDLYTKKVRKMLELKEKLKNNIGKDLIDKIAKEAVAFNILKTDFQKILPVAINNFRFYERACQHSVPASRRAAYQPLLGMLRFLMQNYKVYSATEKAQRKQTLALK